MKHSVAIENVLMYIGFNLYGLLLIPVGIITLITSYMYSLGLIIYTVISKNTKFAEYKRNKYATKVQYLYDVWDNDEWYFKNLANMAAIAKANALGYTRKTCKKYLLNKAE